MKDMMSMHRDYLDHSYLSCCHRRGSRMGGGFPVPKRIHDR